MTFCNVNVRTKSLRPDIIQINLAEFITFFTFSELGLMNEMMGRFVRLIRLNAFSSKAVIKTVHGRSSDLFLLPGAFPEEYSSGIE